MRRGQKRALAALALCLLAWINIAADNYVTALICSLTAVFVVLTDRDPPRWGT